MTATVIAACPVDFGASDLFELSLRAPGIVRACAFWLKQPAVVASAMRGIQPIPMPLLFVECDPKGEMQCRKFAFVPSDRPFEVNAGFEARWLATAWMPAGAGHLFEIVKVAINENSWPTEHESDCPAFGAAGEGRECCCPMGNL